MSRKNRTGRPTKFNPQRARTITKLVREGGTRGAAAAAAGISERTLYDWADQFPQFSQSLKKADAEAELAMVGVIRTAAESGTWQAAAWFLERRHPESWARRSTVDFTTPAAAQQPDPAEINRRIKEIYGITFDDTPAQSPDDEDNVH